jgi:hypothetical protein
MIYLNNMKHNENSLIAYAELPKFRNKHIKEIVRVFMECDNGPLNRYWLCHNSFLNPEQVQKRWSDMQRLGIIKYRKDIDGCSAYSLRLLNEPKDIVTSKPTKATSELFKLKEAYDTLLSNHNKLKIKNLALTNRVNYLENSVIEKSKQLKLSI